MLSNELIEALKKPFKITAFSILNFTNPGMVNIQIDISTKKRMIFKNASSVKVNHYCNSVSERSWIIIEDISSTQMEDVNYHIEISDNIAEFYCKEILGGNIPYKTFNAEHNQLTYKIEEDIPEVGAYLYVFNNNSCVNDFLQNTIQDCKNFALDEFGVPLDKWVEIDLNNRNL